MDCVPQQQTVVGRPVVDHWGGAKGLEVTVNVLQRGGHAVKRLINALERFLTRYSTYDWRHVPPPEWAAKRSGVEIW